MAATALLLASSAEAAPSYPDAVVMVSGYNSATSFTTPDPSCEGQEGDTWSNPAGPAAALRAAGEQVFTAPVQHGSDPLGSPCAPGGTPVPPGDGASGAYLSFVSLYITCLRATGSNFLISIFSGIVFLFFDVV